MPSKLLLGIRPRITTPAESIGLGGHYTLCYQSLRCLSSTIPFCAPERDNNNASNNIPLPSASTSPSSQASSSSSSTPTTPSSPTRLPTDLIDALLKPRPKMPTVNEKLQGITRITKFFGSDFGPGSGSGLGFGPPRLNPAAPGQEQGQSDGAATGAAAAAAGTPELNPAEVEELHRFYKRRFFPGELYTPKDLSFEMNRSWRRRRAPKKDVFDLLGIDPLMEYKNFALLSEYVTPMGRIKHRNETGLRGVNQRKIAKAIRRAVGIGLLPSVHVHPEILKRREDAASKWQSPGQRRIM